MPLQELPISPSGTVVGRRPSTFRPLPSLDKENVHAVYYAQQSRQGHLISHLQAVARNITRARRDLTQAERDLRRSRARFRRQMANQLAAMPHTRLSMPEISDDSSSEPDLSLLGMTRGRQDHLPQQIESPQYEVHEQDQDHLEAEDTSIDDDLVDDEVAEEMGEEEDEEAVEGYQEALADPAALGLKEISNLGRFTVSSHKQGNGVEELRSDDLNLYWQ